MPKKKQGNITDKLMNECTGIMRVDEEGNYAGYYTRWELQKMMLARGDDPKAVDIYVFCGLKGCTEWHPSVEEFKTLELEEPDRVSSESKQIEQLELF
jgi:hypothetical protein